MFNRPKFKNRYHVFSDIYIDNVGIEDGFIIYRWDNIEVCAIGDSDVNELKKYFGDDYDERPFALTITLKDGSKRELTLFGQDWDRVADAAKAINHYSGRQLIPPEQFQGKPIPLSVIIAFVLLTAALVAVAFMNK